MQKKNIKTTYQMKNFEYLLKGGDLRSIGKVNAVMKEIKSQTDFDTLFNELFNSDRKIVMRSADAIEKITIENSGYLSKHTKKILALCETAKDKELKWHLALLVSRIKLTEKEFGLIWQTLTNWATNKNESKIVRVNSIQGLYNLLPQNLELLQDFEITLNEIESENIPSITARIKKLKTTNR